ncbi:hypothetical protein BGZ97_000527 [Linnemannia gamsii]|uniref:Kelch repeat protein n=1 Tax=Linnemannia gamsii TaxID=64522 RepID=A0A9P6R0L6_9FUNG|nr:hypothetical protein BGZ97_000527 [Linnemannia gamsii]
MAYATVDENTLYVHGGVTLPPPGGGGTSNDTSQFFSLDLTQNWDTSNPPWKELTPSPHPTRISRHSMTVSPNRQTLTIWSTYPNTAANYSISTASWTPVPLTPGLLVFEIGLHAASDPTTGAVYIPGANILSDKMMAKLSFLTGMSTMIDLPPAIVTARDAYSFAWCQPRKSFILFMGSNATSTSFFEYKTATNKWTLLVCSSSKGLDAL